jgi:predicted regulator of Ras-like GTPase activity (Roadblock/LC7/MglB family)
MANKDLIIKKEDIHRFNILLTKIVDNARIDCAMLINRSGRLITTQSETNEFDKTSLAALICGNFASSSSIATLIGETSFTCMVQEGEKRHIYISLLDDNTIMACLFDNRSSVEKIKLCLSTYGAPLIDYLTIFYERMESNPDINLDVNYSH